MVMPRAHGCRVLLLLAVLVQFLALTAILWYAKLCGISGEETSEYKRRFHELRPDVTKSPSTRGAVASPAKAASEAAGALQAGSDSDNASNGSGTSAWRLASSDILPLDAESLRLLPVTDPVQPWWATIGLTSVKRKKGEYLKDTILDIMQKLGRLQDVVIVIHLADPDIQWCQHMANWIARTFPLAVQLGHVHMIRAPDARYPPLPYDKTVYPKSFWSAGEFSTHDPGGWNDTEQRMLYRSKHNVDVAFLLHYIVHGVSARHQPNYFVMLEDDILCADQFDKHAKQKTALATSNGTLWKRLDFTYLGYIGKLIPFALLPRLISMHLQLYDRMPADYVFDRMTELYNIKRVVTRPPLFQHVGIFSALPEKVQKLKESEKNFGGDIGRRWRRFLPSNPAGCIDSDLQSYFENDVLYTPSNAYVPVSNRDMFRSMLDGHKHTWFWSGEALMRDNYVVLHLEASVILKAIELRFGRRERQSANDFLRSGIVQVATCAQKDSTPGDKYCNVQCCLNAAYKDVFKVQPVAHTLCEKPACPLPKTPVDCIRILVVEPQAEWLVLDELNILHEAAEVAQLGSTESDALVKNPPALVLSDMMYHWPSHEESEVFAPRRAYEKDASRWFWALGPQAGNYIVVIFERALASIDEVTVIFGHPKAPQDVLQDGIIELGIETDAYHQASRTERHLRGVQENFCHYTMVIATVQRQRKVTKEDIGSPEDAKGWRCLRILVQKEQSSWVAVQRIFVEARLVAAGDSSTPDSGLPLSSLEDAWAIESLE